MGTGPLCTAATTESGPRDTIVATAMAAGSMITMRAVVGTMDGGPPTWSRSCSTIASRSPVGEAPCALTSMAPHLQCVQWIVWVLSAETKLAKVAVKPSCRLVPS